jgi:hypothetical protein
MNINETNANSHQIMPINEVKQLITHKGWGRGQALEQGQNFFSVLHVATCQFTNDEGVAYHMSLKK